MTRWGEGEPAMEGAVWGCRAFRIRGMRARSAEGNEGEQNISTIKPVGKMQGGARGETSGIGPLGGMLSSEAVSGSVYPFVRFFLCLIRENLCRFFFNEFQNNSG